ncbi:MAG TPA: hypothetical protein VL588_07540 [Bdellovibrionota bacterium]|jgi:hypothetical protein|nr:hypothetical protein [Bdellovibrionota bacterium]
MAKDEKIGHRIRENIQANIQRAEATQRREFFKHRVDVAKEGIKHYKNQEFPQAVTAFKKYIRILEEWKSAAEGGIAPTFFDKSKDSAELLLIAGLYWDLAKLYDRTRSHMKYEEFVHYLDKYVQFSKGMPYEPVCAETLRKYVANGKSLHTDEFKAAYRRMVGEGSKCFVATALADVCDPLTLPRLRRFRDHTLAVSAPGRGAIRLYYTVGPWAARIALRAPEPVRKRAGSALDALALRLNR